MPPPALVGVSPRCRAFRLPLLVLALSVWPSARAARIEQTGGWRPTAVIPAKSVDDTEASSVEQLDTGSASSDQGGVHSSALAVQWTEAYRVSSALERWEKKAGEGRGRGRGPRSHGGGPRSHDGELRLARPPPRKPKGPPAMFIYTLELSAESTAELRAAWQQYSSRVPQMIPVSEYHVTLLYLGGGSDAEIAKRTSTLNGAEDVALLRENLASSEGREMQVEVQFVVWDDRIAAAEVRGDFANLCANRHPHITLATAKGVPPVKSNEILARREAAEDLSAGLGEWLEQLSLRRYEAPLLEWCTSSGASCPEAIAEEAAEAAAAIAENTVEATALERVLAGAAAGELSVEVPPEPLFLTGTVRGRRRGEKIGG